MPSSDDRGDGGATAPSSAAVALMAITKRFGNVVACDAVDLALYPGRIHGILGENGAGKSTLMKVLIGLVLPDAGHIEIRGERRQIRDPIDAAGHGIAMVHQHYSLVDTLTVWENVALGDSGRLDPAPVRERVGELSRHYGLDIEPDALVGDLPAGLRQRVEIIKCLRRDPQILVFDEPTSVLTPEESEQLFVALRRVVDEEGRAVALVSHKLDEVLHATDEITIMRRGAVVERVATGNATAADLARAMVGRAVSLRGEAAALGLSDELTASDAPAPISEGTAAPVLALHDVVVRRRDGRRLLDGLTIEVRPGEIVGVAGVEGNGQRALADLLSSLEHLSAGRVEVAGQRVVAGRAGAMADAGVAVIPEDRHDSGVVLDMTVAENLFLVDVDSHHSYGWLDRRRMRQRAEELVDRFGVQCDGIDAPMWSLSGGNQQRVVLARELSHEPKVLVAAQPTRGLDVGAIDYMSAQIRQVAERGVGVLLISSELDEILDLASRIVVIFEGRIIGEMPRSEATRERLGLLLGGRVEADVS